LVSDRTFEKYLSEVESITGLEISKEQRVLLKDDINNNSYTRLTPDENRQHRREFGKVRAELISEWEEHCGMKWPTYPEDKIYNGKVIRQKGAKFDAHELILCSWNSPHVWYNLTPCATPEHQQQIHGKGSMANKIFA
jgi:predicted ribonuclease toxin of YeeF-YezG toxin-antitoxin module